MILVLCFSATISAVRLDVEQTINNESFDLKFIPCDKTWTVMFYLAFDNHRTAEKEYTFDFIKGVGSDENLNFVILYDGSEFGDTCYCHLEGNIVKADGWFESESDMGEGETLQHFLESVISDFPADYYALFVLSTHGSGWQGLGSDQNKKTTKNLNLLDMEEWTDVLSEITNDGADKIDVIGYDICITGSVEAAYQISPYVDYVLMNEEHGFGGSDFPSDDGYPLDWNYSEFLQQLKDNPNTTPEEFAKSVVDTYRAGTYTSRLFDRFKAPKFYPIAVYHTVLSATNLSRIDVLADAVEQLSTTLQEDLGQCRNEIRKARYQSREYGKLYRRFYWLPVFVYYLQLDPLGYNGLIDLYDFAEKLMNETMNQDIKDACQQVMDAMNTTILACESTPYDPSYGLYIYFPKHRCQYDVSFWRVLGKSHLRILPVSYEDIMFSQDTGWNEFLEDYLRV